MKALQKYVAEANSWNKIFNSKQYDLDCPADRQAIANKIDSALSPENLSCDGELPAAQVKFRYNNLIKVAKELQQLDPFVEFYEFN